MKSKARQLWHKKSVIAVAVGLVCSHHAMGAGPVAQKALPLVQNARPKTPLPSGMSVVSGNANAQQSGNTLTVNNSANAVLNWQQFSVASGHAVHFQQPSAASQVLNRVVGQDPSYILGNLSSNGGVWLLNPNGVLFGADARINVQGLVASDLWTTGAGFGGKTTLTSTGNNASFGVINQGNIRTAYGGQVVLAGTSVQNLGQIHAPGGQAALLAANAVELTDTALPYLSFKVPLPSGTASNSGTVQAQKIDMYGAVVRQDGLIEANAVSHNELGQVVLSATESVTVSGIVSASNDQGAGGSVSVQGNEVVIANGASINASGATQGGTVAIGVDVAQVLLADTVQVQAGAAVRADATSQGKGGRIDINSATSTTVAGNLSARGGVSGGDGGFIETSSHGSLTLDGKVDASAPKGKPGQWLLDPTDVTIAAVAGAGVVTTGSIVASLNAGTDVDIQTTSGGTEQGNITLQDPINVTPSNGPRETLHNSP